MTRTIVPITLVTEQIFLGTGDRMKRQEWSLVFIGILTVLFIFSSLVYSGNDVDNFDNNKNEAMNEYSSYDKLFVIDQ
ncbi:hypothetical protein [Bacillus sp. JCM 19041]|uniref:hypothetical protein n=1 Tax=Bacillus sp. JCM 19041 TaxID=1460637 RepID=UPI000A9545E8